MMEQRFVSDNGIEVFGYKNAASHGFFISLFLRSGSMYESESENGITHFLEHVLVRNVNSVMSGELYKTLDAAGLEFNASSFAEMVQFYISGATHRFSLGAEIIARLLSPLSLSRAEIDAERRRIKAEIRESDDKNALSTFSNTAVHSGTSLAMSIVGTNGSVDKINGKRLEEYRRRVFNKNNVFLYITGNYMDEDVEGLLAQLSKYGLSDGVCHENLAPVPLNFGKRDAAVHVKNADFTLVRFTFDLDMLRLGVPETDLIYDILFAGYASRFFMELSERRGMFYDVTGAVERYRNIGEMYFSYEIREQELYEALEISVSILKRLKTEPLSEEELMKAGYVDNAYVLFDDPREFNFTFAYDAHIMRLPYKSLEERINAYRAVSPERLMAAARLIFRPENLTFTMKGKKKKTDAFKIREILSEL